MKTPAQAARDAAPARPAYGLEPLLLDAAWLEAAETLDAEARRILAEIAADPLVP